MSTSGLFAWPEGLPILILAPVLWLALFVLDRVRQRRLRGGIGPRALNLAAELDMDQRRVRRRLITAGMLLALLAMLQPLWGEGFRKVDQRGVDLVVCLDVSRSMLARDLPPSRLERARYEIRTLAEQVRGDRLGLVVFAGEARLSVPLTRDMDSFADLVDQAGPLDIRRGGTDLGAALETALDALKLKTGDHESVLLLTDGEDLGRMGLTMAEQCRERGIVVHCVGFGSTRGSKIAVEDEGGEAFLRDRTGNEVVSAMNTAGLRRIAETAGGAFVNAGRQPLPLLDLYEKRILPMAEKAFEEEGRRERKNRFQWPLLAAYLLLIMELCLTDRKRS